MVALFDKSIKDSVQIIRRETVYDGFYQLKTVTLRHRLFKGGWTESIQREVLMRGNSVAILLFDPNIAQFVFIEEFRIGALMANEQLSSKESQISPWLLEVAGGIVDSKESLEHAASREAQEETGLTVQKLLPICDYWINPANTTEKITLFCGQVQIQDSSSHHGVLAEGEDIRLHLVSLQEAYEYLEMGKIKYAHALIALQWFKLNEKKIFQWMK